MARTLFGPTDRRLLSVKVTPTVPSAPGTSLSACCADSQLERERCLRLNLVLEELFINTVNHGHRGDCDAPIWILLDAQPQAVQLTYEDTAPPFNPFAYRVEMGKVGGLGVLLTR